MQGPFWQSLTPRESDNNPMVRTPGNPVAVVLRMAWLAAVCAVLMGQSPPAPQPALSDLAAELVPPPAEPAPQPEAEPATTVASTVLEAAAEALAGEPDPTAAGLERRVALMDFEEFGLHGIRLPKGWYRDELPGGRFPQYVTGELTGDRAHGGRWSFRLRLNGGNVAYTYLDRLPVNPHNDYVLVGWVRTEGLRVARAQARMFLIDADGEPIEDSLAVSEPLGGPNSPADGQWHRFTLRLAHVPERAAQLRVTLGLLQPSVWQGAEVQRIYQQDITGSVWWDDIAIYRLPGVTLETGAAANVFAPAEAPSLTATLDGLDAAQSAVVLSVRDAAGDPVHQRVLEIDPTQTRNRLTAELPNLEPGLYVGELAVAVAGRTLLKRSCPFVRLGPLPATGRSGLTVDASSEPPARWDAALAFARTLRLEGLVLPTWPTDQPPRAVLPEPLDPDDPLAPFALLSTPTAPATAPGNASASQAGSAATAPPPVAPELLAMFRRCRALGVVPALAVNLPPALRDGPELPGTVVEELAKANPALLGPLAELVARVGSGVGAWQLTAEHPDLDRSALIDPALVAAAETNLRGLLGRLLVAPELRVPWNAHVACDLPSQPTLSAFIPTTIAPERIAEHLASLGCPVGQVHLEVLDADVPRLARLGDLALRYAHSLAAGVGSIALDPPWSVDGEGQVSPDEALLVARTLSAYLGEARFLGTLQLDESAVALAFQQAGRAVLVVYDTTLEAHRPPVALELPRRAQAVDLWGRPSELERRDGLALLRPAAMPMLVVDADPEPIALAASVRFTPDRLPSEYARHAVRVAFTNPYPWAVSGEIRLTGPAGWRIEPAWQPFHLGAGQSWSGEMAVVFPYNEPAGLKRFEVAVEVDANDAWSVRCPAWLRLGLESLAMDLEQDLDADAILTVRQTVTNRSTQPLSAECYVHIPGRPRQRALIQDLAPGQSAIQSFRFPDALGLRGRPLHAGVRDLDSPAMLNHADRVR